MSKTEKKGYFSFLLHSWFTVFYNIRVHICELQIYYVMRNNLTILGNILYMFEYTEEGAIPVIVSGKLHTYGSYKRFLILTVWLTNGVSIIARLLLRQSYFKANLEKLVIARSWSDNSLERMMRSKSRGHTRWRESGRETAMRVHYMRYPRALENESSVSLRFLFSSHALGIF